MLLVITAVGKIKPGFKWAEHPPCWVSRNSKLFGTARFDGLFKLLNFKDVSGVVFVHHHHLNANGCYHDGVASATM